MKTLSGSRKRVLFILPSLSPGGAERVLITLMNSLNKSRFSPSLISVMPKAGLDTLVDKEILIRRLNKGGVLRALPALRKKIKEAHPDIIVSTMAHMNFAVLLLKPFFPDIKFIVREAITPSFFFQKKGPRALLVKLGYKLLYKRADALIAPSDIILDEFKNKLRIEHPNYILLKNPVDTDALLAKAGTPNFDDTLKFVAAGRLHPQKGFDRLIVALKDFQPDANWRLDIWGEGEQRDALCALIAENGLGNKITLRGHTDNPWQYYATADCLLLPSRWEGLPNVALEALACGTPIIAMNEAGGIGEIAAKTEAGVVRIAHSMNEFTTMMQTARQKTSIESLLPDAFRKQNIEKQFEELLFRIAYLKDTK